MANLHSFFSFEYDLHSSSNGGQLNSNNKVLDEQKWNLAVEDQMWNLAAKKLALENQMRAKFESSKNSPQPSAKGTAAPAHNSKSSTGGTNKPSRAASSGGKNKHKALSASAQNDMVNSMINKLLNVDLKQQGVRGPDVSQKGILPLSSSFNHPNVHSPTQNSSSINSVDKRFKSLPPAESLPRNETLGGYIFVCNNDTMQEDLKRQLFGLPPRYRDSVRAIQPGLPLFLYNYTTHQLHGIFEAASFGGSNIDPTAWEDKKNKGESRFPAQVRIRVRKICKPLEEDAFRPVLFHYDGPKFRLQLSVPETLAVLDLLSGNGSS